MKKDYQICTRCVMDTTAPEISFNEQGICNYCIEFDEVTSRNWFPNEVGMQKLKEIIENIKNKEKNKPYDCILGLSGGIDSSYLALKVHEMELRPLVVHVDGGWNTELAVGNIEKIVNYCGWDLHTIVIDWEEMRDLQVAYLKSGVANQDVPQDHAFFASLYHYATKNKIKYIVNGGNLATESIFPNNLEYDAMDSVNIKAIHKRFGTNKLKNYKTISFFDYYFYYPFIKKMKTIRPLNYMPYNKFEALDELKQKLCYKEYDRKHGESIFTKYFQNYYQPVKFGFDKRRAHLSSMIVAKLLTREEAVKELEKPLYEAKELKADREYIAKKLGLTLKELEDIEKVPIHTYRDFANTEWANKLLKKIQLKVSIILKRRIANYS